MCTEKKDVDKHPVYKILSRLWIVNGFLVNCTSVPGQTDKKDIVEWGDPNRFVPGALLGLTFHNNKMSHIWNMNELIMVASRAGHTFLGYLYMEDDSFSVHVICPSH